ncbi:MAG: bacterial transcriptional activator domain-containing protein, partial [Microthrixaceae bacterium]|nr:bacterial transcriptional activator domain-containing protein [Microthrixaceae bacterium]
ETTHTEASNGDVAKGDTAQSDESSNRAPPIGLAASGLSSVALAVGLKRLLGRRRQRFANRHPGQLPGRVPAEHREFHQGLIAQADEELIVDLQCALSRLAVVLAEAGSERRPRIVRHSPDCLEVLLDQPDTSAPPGWISTDDGTVWTLISPPEEDYLAEAELTPSPLMVTVGQPDEDAQLYLDLEAEGLLSLTGDRDVATSLARSIVTELTLSPLAGSLRVIVVGDIISSEAKVLDHLRIVDNWNSLVEDLTSWATESHETLVEHNWGSTFVGRAHEPDHDALIPVAVVAAEPPPSELMKALQAAWPSAVAVVAVGEFDGALASIRCEEDALNFDTIGLACSPQKLEADGLAAISSILAATESPAEPSVAEQLQVEFEESASLNLNGCNDHHAPIALAEFAVAPECPPEYDVLVRLLGDITVEGGEPLRPKATAVVAYLALHRSVTTERLEEACWFGSDGASHTKRLHDTMTESRSALGSQHFPANRGGSYVAGPRVLTDLDIFDWLVHQAADLPPDEAVGRYVAALDLVTGRPFAYPNSARASYGWVDFEHHATTWELRVSGVAQACAAMYLDMGEPDAAIAMLRRIVRAVPLNSAVVEALMRAHIAGDDRSGMESVYKEHAAALDQAKLGDPTDSIEQLRLDLQVT